MFTMSGGAKLNACLNNIAKKLGASKLKVGFLKGATYPDGTPVATVAAIQNFGAPAAGIPPRPFFSNTVARNREAWPGQVGKALQVSKLDATTALSHMGDVIAGQLRESINELDSPPLSPVTLMLRKMRVGKLTEPVTFGMVQEARQRVADGENPGVTGTWAKPLVDSGHLLASVDIEVNGVRRSAPE